MNAQIKTVAAMTNEDLCALAGDLGRDYVENEASGALFGIVLVEQACRFARMMAASRPPEGGTTNGEEEG